MYSQGIKSDKLCLSAIFSSPHGILVTQRINLSSCKFWKRLSKFAHSSLRLNFNLIILVFFNWNWNLIKTSIIGINPYVYQKLLCIRKLIIQNIAMSVSVIQIATFKCPLPFKSLSWSFLVTLGWAWPSSAPACFLYLRRQKRAPTRSWAQGPHMVKSIPEFRLCTVFLK